MRELVVYGASGFGQQVMFWVEDAVAGDARFELLGYVDDNPATHGEVRSGYPVLGDREWLRDRAAEREVSLVFGVAGPSVKERVVAGLGGATIDFPSLAHPSAVISRHASLGSGVIVGPANVISVGVRIRDFVTVNTACTIGHDARVGRYATLLPGVNVSGAVAIGDGVSIGTGTAIVQDVTIGPAATVGAGATVVSDLPGGCVAMGTPARPREPAR